MTVTFTELAEVQAWQSRAACHPSRKPAELSPAEWTSVFFPTRGDSRTLRRALEVCEVCEVREECSQYAGATRDGIWGGLSGRRRRSTVEGLGRGPTSRHSPATRNDVLRRLSSGESQAEIHRRTGIAVATIRRWRTEAA